MLLAITYLSIFKVPEIPPLEEVVFADKWGHMLAYAVWAWCLLADGTRAGWPKRRCYMVAIILTIAYGGLMEIIQHYCFTYRQGEWLDWLADITGIVLATLLFCGVSAILHHKH